MIDNTLFSQSHSPLSKNIFLLISIVDLRMKYLYILILSISDLNYYM